MPIYEYKCDCGQITERLESMNQPHKECECKFCGQVASRYWSVPNLVTDTNFLMTGEYDSRLGKKVEGRKDFWDTAKKKGLVEVDLKQV